jgi:hypothetical protein
MEDIIEELCNKYGMSKTAMKAVCESPFRFMSEEIRNGNTKNFNFLGLGKFGIKTRYKNDQERLNKLIEKHGNKDRPDSGRVEKPGMERSEN